MKDLLKETIQIVEERGFPNTKYIAIIDYLAKVAQGYISNGTYHFIIPEAYLGKIDIYEHLELVVNVENIIGQKDINVLINLRGEGAKEYVNQETLNKDKTKFKNGKIIIDCIAYNGSLITKTFTSPLSHELNHAAKELAYRKTMNPLDYYDYAIEKYNKANALSYNNDEKNDKLIHFLIYRLLDPKEIDAAANAVYEDLNSINSKRQNFHNDIKTTQAYQEYLAFVDLIKQIASVLSNDDWENIRKTMNLISKYKKYNKTNLELKRDFINKLKHNNDYYRRKIGQIASLYYDYSELKENLSTKKSTFIC